MPLFYHELSTPEIRRVAASGVLLVIPWGSIEQHCNAPSGLDYLISMKLSIRACELLENKGEGRCVIAPPVPYGFSPEWSRIGGTISVSLETMKGLISDILGSAVNAGFRKIAIINAHGGNSGLLQAVTREWLSKRPGLIVSVVDYWREAGINLGHADKIEETIAKYLGVLDPNFSIDCDNIGSMDLLRITSGPERETGIQGYISGDFDPKRLIESIYQYLKKLATVT